MPRIDDVMGRIVRRARAGEGAASKAFRAVLGHSFGRPRGILGRLGGAVMARRNREVNAWVVGLLDLAPDHQVLEVGFGPGVAIEALAQAVPRGRVCGVDPSAQMVLMAQRRNRAPVEAGQVTLALGTAAHLPWPDATFDRALCVNNLQLWPDAGAGLREVLRVLKPGGRFAVAFAHRALQAEAGWLEWLSDAGFTGLELMERDGAACAIVEKRARR